MAYVKKYVGKELTGKMCDCIIEREDGTKVNLGQYPEERDVHKIVWETKWRPEHFPVGTRVRYCVTHRGEEDIKEAVVTGIIRNGVESWVIKTDDVCSIFGGNKKESFNVSYVTEILERGTGEIRQHDALGDNTWAAQDYSYQAASCESIKQPSNYCAISASTVVFFVLYNHPAFSGYRTGEHVYDDTAVIEAVRHLFKVDKRSGFLNRVTVNKKKLVRELKRVLPHKRISLDKLRKEEKEAERIEYEQNMKDFDEMMEKEYE